MPVRRTNRFNGGALGTWAIKGEDAMSLGGPERDILTAVVLPGGRRSLGKPRRLV